MSSILIVIPVYNESRYIAQLVQDIRSIVPGLPILIVNDGSTDDTADQLQVIPDISIIHHSRNKGKGAAILNAADYARKHGYAWMITLDGDGQHPPEHLPAFIKSISNTNAALVLGNRQSRSAGMPWHRRFSNGTTSVMVSFCCGQRVHDSQCGYRAIRISALHAQYYRENGFQFESEMILRIGKQGGIINEIPVETRYNDEASSINLVTDTLRFVKLILNSFTW